MEIRSALQKIENYLTVVSNLNKTILSEGTMSRDELLLMKKYLYTSIDRIEDIERSLIIDKKEDKSFTPTETLENVFVPTKTKEIVEVAETDHIEEVEAVMTVEQKEELEDLVEDIQAELLAENKVVEQPKIEEFTAVETNIVAENLQNDIALEANIVTTNESNVVDIIEEKLTVADNIVAETNSLNVVTENVETIPVFENKMEEVKAEILPLIENVTSNDNTSVVNAFTETTIETIVENKIEEVKQEVLPLVENVAVVESISNTNEENNKVETIAVTNEVNSTSLIDKVKAEVENVTETISAKFEENKSSTFVDELAKNKKEELSFLEKFEQKLNATSHPQLFQLFDDGKEDLHESFANNKPVLEPVNTSFDKPSTNTSFESNDTVLVVEKEVETIVEQLTPSSLNDVFKPQTVVETISTKSTKSLSESIALNDKFIFVRELFGNQFAEYENALKHLDNFSSFSEVEQYCNNTLWNKFNWTERASAAGRFMDLIAKKYK